MYFYIKCLTNEDYSTSEPSQDLCSLMICYFFSRGCAMILLHDFHALAAARQWNSTKLAHCTTHTMRCSGQINMQMSALEMQMHHFGEETKQSLMQRARANHLERIYFFFGRQGYMRVRWKRFRFRPNRFIERLESLVAVEVWAQFAVYFHCIFVFARESSGGGCHFLLSTFLCAFSIKISWLAKRRATNTGTLMEANSERWARLAINKLIKHCECMTTVYID